MQLVWTSGAREDLRELVLYIAQDDPSAARRMAARLKGATRLIQEHPEAGRMVPEFSEPRLRERIVPPYRLVYRLDREAAVVLAVVHSRRRMPAVEAGPKD
ncbi:MAG: type II toxin-antitoxin system RelE/ParE family toxin [Myxococcota bacterium]|nr:type II toxin-antitoxin system RelE/ParE family toxin [Myxococcota bacterium]